MAAQSESELGYALSGLQNGRRDGRSGDQFRAIALSTGVAPSTNGSARVVLAGTEVIVACRLEVEEVDPLAPSAPSLHCSIESLPTAAHQVSEAAIGLLADHLQRLFGSCAAGLQFVIAPHRTYWSLALEVLVVSGQGGNVFDAVALAARAALADLRIPRVRVTGLVGRRDQGDKSAQPQRAPNSMLKAAARSKQTGRSAASRTEFDLESYWDDGAPLEGQDELPLSVSVVMSDRNPCIDPDAYEELSAPPRIVYAIDRAGSVVSTQLSGDGELNWKLAPACSQMAVNAAAELHHAVNDHLAHVYRRV